MECNENNTECGLEDMDSNPFGTTHSFHKLGPVTSPHWTSDFFCKVRGLDNVIAKAFCSFVGLNIGHIRDKYQIM